MSFRHINGGDDDADVLNGQRCPLVGRKENGQTEKSPDIVVTKCVTNPNAAVASA